MGFRTYIGRMSKDSAEKIKILTLKDIAHEFGEGSDDIDVYPPGPYELAEEVYELGKYVEVTADSFRLFDDDDVEEHYNSDYLFHGLTKKGFAEIINQQRENISKYYKTLNDSYGIVGVDQFPIKEHLNSMASEWNNKWTNPVDLDNGSKVTSSWKFEYTIFELIRLYKTFDWENDIAVIYGY